MYILFTYELIDVKISDQLDQNSIIIQKQSQNIHKFIKNGRQIKQLVQTIKNINKNFNNTIQVISYSAKSKSACKKVYDAIDQSILKQWIFIDDNKKKYVGIPSNRAFKSFNGDICFGQGYSQSSVKGELRLAIHSSLRNFQKSNFIILEKSPQEVQQLIKKEKYKYVFTGLPTSLQLQKTIKEIQQRIDKKIKEQFNFGQHIQHNLSQLLQQRSLINDRIQFYNIGKGRTPKSKSISSYIALNRFDNKLYIHKTDKTYEIGGQFYSQQLENIQLVAELHNFCSAKALPHYRYLGDLSLKYILLSSYDKKKAIMSSKPYIHGLNNISQALQTKEDILLLLKQNRFQGKKVKGLGYLLALSIVCGQNFKAKSFLQQVGFVSFPIKQQKMTQQKDQQLIQVFRFDFHDVFSLKNYEGQDKSIFRISQHLHDFSLNDLSNEIISQIKQMYQRINHRVKLIHGLFNHHRWQFSKAEMYNIFNLKLKIIDQIFKLWQNIKQNQEKQKQTQFKLSPIEYNLLVGDNYSWFTKSNSQLQMFQTPNQNIYLTTMKRGTSFQLHSSMPQLNLLLRWIARKYAQVQYISLLRSTKNQCINLSKKMKHLVSNDKNKSPRILVIDHCQLSPDVVSLHRPVKMIFITRLKRVQADNLPVIKQTQCHKCELLQSQEELFKVLIKQFQNEQSLYKKYQMIILTWIQNKSLLYKIPMQNCLQMLKKLASAITFEDNRLSDIQSKQLYCLPVYKQRQKIYLAHDIYKFIRAKHLFDDILEEKWKGTLQGQQLQHFTKWISFCPKQTQQLIKQKLIKFLLICKIRQDKIDTIQLLKTLTNQIFLLNCQQFTYSVIKSIHQHQNYHIVIAKNNVIWYEWNQMKAVFKISDSYNYGYIYKDNLILKKIEEIPINKSYSSINNFQQIVQFSNEKELQFQQIQKKQERKSNKTIVFDIFDINQKQAMPKKSISYIINNEKQSYNNEKCFYLFRKIQIFYIKENKFCFINNQKNQYLIQNQKFFELPQSINSIQFTNSDKIIAVSDHRVYLIQIIQNQEKIIQDIKYKLLFDHPNGKITSLKYKYQINEKNYQEFYEIINIIVEHSSILTILEINSQTKIQLKHQNPVVTASASFLNNKIHSFVKNDDILIQWDLKSQKIIKIYYQVQISSLNVMVHKNSFVIQGFGYLKKTIL